MAGNAWTTIYLNVNIILNAYIEKKKFLNQMLFQWCDHIKT